MAPHTAAAFAVYISSMPCHILHCSAFLTAQLYSFDNDHSLRLRIRGSHLPKALFSCRGLREAQRNPGHQVLKDSHLQRIQTWTDSFGLQDSSSSVVRRVFQRARRL